MSAIASHILAMPASESLTNLFEKTGHPVLRQAEPDEEFSPTIMDQLRWIPCRVIHFMSWLMAQIKLVLHFLGAPFRFISWLMAQPGIFLQWLWEATLKPFYDMTIGALLKFIFDLKDMIIDFIMGIKDAVIDFIMKYVNIVIDFFMDLKTKIIDFVMKYVNIVLDFIIEIKNMIMEFITKLWDATFGAVFHAIWKLYDATIGAFRRWMAELFAKLWDATIGKLLAMLGLPDFNLMGIIEWLINFIINFPDWLMGLPDWFCGDYNDLYRSDKDDMEVEVEVEVSALFSVSEL